MSKQALKFISDQLKSENINYEFGAWTTDPVPDPYFVGEYVENEALSEDGLQNMSFVLTGTGTTWLALEQAKEKIEKLFSKVSGKTAILPNGNGIAVFYFNSLTVPTGDMELKRIQVNLEVKEWSVNDNE